MTTTNFKRPNRGAQLLSRVADSGRAVAGHMGVSTSTAGYWRTGERKPNPGDRERLRDRYGIPVEAWDEAPAKIGRPPKSNEAPPPAAVDAAATSAELDEPGEPRPVMPTADVAHLDGSLNRNAVRLNRMILSDIARLEGADGSDLELGKRAEILKKLSDAQVALAKATGETHLTLERIVAHPEFVRVVRLITEAIAPYPEALAAATKALETGSA